MTHANTRALLPGGDVKHIKNQKIMYDTAQHQQSMKAPLNVVGTRVLFQLN